MHSEKGSTASSKEDTGNEISVKSNAPQTAKDGKQVGARCVCYPFRLFLLIKMKGNQSMKSRLRNRMCLSLIGRIKKRAIIIELLLLLL